MDFGRALVAEASTASLSKIAYTRLEKTDESSDETTIAKKEGNGDQDTTSEDLDRMAIRAANHAARSVLIGPPAIGETHSDSLDEDTIKWIDTSLYTDRSLPSQPIIREGDLVVTMISFDNLDFVYAQKNKIFSNRNGHFHHNDFLGKPFGSKIRSRNNEGYGFCYVLKPTPELWARSLNHRTQIVHELDQSQIIFQLQIRPNNIVVESGTGSAAMSHSIARTIAPAGQLYTYEFNPHRAQTAAEEFKLHGLSHLVTVQNVDVCALGFPKVKGATVDGVFLDLPEPWTAVPHAAWIMKPNARLASYSPCVEQTQRTVQALEKAGFHSIHTFEYRLMENYVDEVSYLPPPRLKRPNLLDSSISPKEQQQIHQSKRQRKKANKKRRREEETNDSQEDSKSDDDDNDQNDQEESTDSPSEQTEALGGPKMLCARPFGLMRGHTAFLTFATAGLLPQPRSPSNEKDHDS